jgi:hypothetical protein
MVSARGCEIGSSTALADLADEVAAGKTGRWLRGASKFGLVARGVVYLLVGYLTLRLALAAHGRAAEPASAGGAVQEAARHAWGAFSLVPLAAGFAGYSLTQLVEAIFRPRYAASRLSGWRQRIISTWGCLLYAAFSVSTISVLAAIQSPDTTAGSEQQQDKAISATLMSSGPGRVLFLLVGVLLVFAGAELGRRSIRLTFQERFTPEARHRLFGVGARALGALGCVARAAVFALVGVFIVRAGVLNEPGQTKGLDAAFRSVADTDYGTLTLAALAVGLFSYGLYCLLEARYRDLTPGR